MRHLCTKPGPNVLDIVDGVAKVACPADCIGDGVCKEACLIKAIFLMSKEDPASSPPVVQRQSEGPPAGLQFRALPILPRRAMLRAKPILWAVALEGRALSSQVGAP